ncbi:TadG family pilus assembly protein [Paraburkholderia sp. DHOC27]|uniref:TadG family pilus assembly protein n=1 Tax=Paraburkholderia sp. DHOC27 TaxID=2303330 RepID=UPI000E3E0DD0|nr:TadG family pilus assembly protein [Paraburkholderia sp. DHOC27]RFU47975.1 hypothetical protein D0B32_10650 [Paraburkholderia sp. DHOC27]
MPRRFPSFVRTQRSGESPAALHVRRDSERMARVRAVTRRRQRGSTLLVAALCLAIALAALGAIDVGNFYFMRRDLQRTADLAAAAGAQTIGSATSTAGDCAAATASAQQNAQTGNNMPNATVTVVCGRWDPSVNAGQSYFALTGTPMNAVQVTVQQTVPYFFMGPARTLQATATAQSTNVRSFSVTTAVASLSGGLLNGLLNGLLGGNLNLSVASYQGLASAQIKLGDLATALGVGSMSQLLNTQVTLAQLVRAMATAVSQSTTASATVITDLGTIAASIPGGQQIALGNSAGTNGLLAVALGDPQAAATATVNVLDALMVAAEIGNGQSAINLGTALNLGALANVTAQARLLEPPVIAVGEAGFNADGTPRTSAHSAAVRLYLNVQLLNVNLLGIVQMSALNLPVSIDVASGTAGLQSTQCTTSKAASQSVISAQAGVASLCVGMDAASNLTNYKTLMACNTPVPVTSLTVLGVDALSLYVGNPTAKPTPTGLLLNLQQAQPATMTFNGIVGDSDDYQSTNTNALGSATSGVLTQVVSALSSSVYAVFAGVPLTNGLVYNAVVGLLNALVNLLTPILNSLDALLVPLLQLLGVQIGVVTVHDLGLTCGQAQLVY